MVARNQLGQTSLSLSAIGFGASPLGEAFGEIDPGEATRAVHLAIECGINYFDVSPYYGNTLAETRLGDALSHHRDGVVLSTKCGRYGAAEFDFSPARITREFELSLKRLRTDHVDLLLAHDIEFAQPNQIVEETIPAMRRLQEQGKVGSVGVSGFPLGELARTIERIDLDAVLTYCHYNLLNTSMDDGLTALAQRRGVGLINASPLHMGILGGLPTPAWHPAPANVRAAGPAFAALCHEFGLAPATVALHFCLAHPGVASTLIGIATRVQVEENLAALDLFVPGELRDRIETLLAPVRNVEWPSGRADANLPHAVS